MSLKYEPQHNLHPTTITRLTHQPIRPPSSFVLSPGCSLLSILGPFSAVELWQTRHDTVKHYTSGGLHGIKKEFRGNATRVGSHPGGNPGANLKSISHRCHPILVAFVRELTQETINLPLGCLEGGAQHHSTPAC